jgi:hypothetical protein
MEDDEARARARPRPCKKTRRRTAGPGAGLTHFALRLAKQLSDRAGSGDNNLVFSPLSI